jgi:hypothetical protein
MISVMMDECVAEGVILCLIRCGSDDLATLISIRSTCKLYVTVCEDVTLLHYASSFWRLVFERRCSHSVSPLYLLPCKVLDRLLTNNAEKEVIMCEVKRTHPTMPCLAKSIKDSALECLRHNRLDVVLDMELEYPDYLQRVLDATSLVKSISQHSSDDVVKYVFTHVSSTRVIPNNVVCRCLGTNNDLLISLVRDINACPRKMLLDSCVSIKHLGSMCDGISEAMLLAQDSASLLNSVTTDHLACYGVPYDPYR